MRFLHLEQEGSNSKRTTESAISSRETVIVCFGEPRDLLIDQAFVPVHGWYAADGEPTSVGVRISGHKIRFTSSARYDVEALYPDKFARGFSTVLDLSRLLDIIADNSLVISIIVDQREVASRKLTLMPGALKAAVEARATKMHKRAWVMSHLCCPVCRQELAVCDTLITCVGCGARYEQRYDAVNMIPPEQMKSCQVESMGGISMHGYDETARSIIEGVRGSGGMVLDCGAGLRHYVDANIITTEIADYPTTDVLAFNQSLPFEDNTFDAVLSLHVLEHIADPFRSARELVRVLKPGGTLLCVIPLLAPEHGFPYHYFNMTGSGLVHLFEDRLVIEKEFIPVSGQPINSLHWILDLYQQYLPQRTRERFRSMTVDELLSKPVRDWLDDDIAKYLAEYAKWTIASNIALVGKKPAACVEGIGRQETLPPNDVGRIGHRGDQWSYRVCTGSRLPFLTEAERRLPEPTPWWKLPGRALSILWHKGGAAFVREMRSYFTWLRHR